MQCSRVQSLKFPKLLLIETIIHWGECVPLQCIHLFLLFFYKNSLAEFRLVLNGIEAFLLIVLKRKCRPSDYSKRWNILGSPFWRTETQCRYTDPDFMQNDSKTSVLIGFLKEEVKNVQYPHGSCNSFYIRIRCTNILIFWMNVAFFLAIIVS